MDLILRSIERMLQTQLSMARRFKLQVLDLQPKTLPLIFRTNKYKVAENGLRHMLLKLIIDRV